MTTSYALARLGRAGWTIESTRNLYTATLAGQCIEWIDQQGEALCLSVRRAWEQHDSQSDYHAGMFVSSLASALRIASRAEAW